MPEDNRFAGLSEAVEGDESDPDEPEPDADSSDDASTEVAFESPSSGASRGTGLDERESESESDEDDCEPAVDSSDDDPTAFPFDATEKKTVYVRPKTVDDLEDARALVDAQLRTDHDVRDLTGREFYDAVFRFAAADTDGLIDEILEAREE